MFPPSFHWDSYHRANLIPQTSVTVQHYAAYHSSLNFHRPDEFIPERFIDKDNFHDRRDVLQPFSFGPRNCIGKK